MGPCLGKQQLADTSLIRKPGAENLAWLDELAYWKPPMPPVSLASGHTSCSQDRRGPGPKEGGASQSGKGHALRGPGKVHLRGTGGAGQCWRLENLKSFDEFLDVDFRIREGKLTT